MIPFNKPHITGHEIELMMDAVAGGHISGNGKYTKLCHRFFEQKWGFRKTLLTTSCTDALEMCALLLDIQLGDEVIMPSFTFVSTAQAFVRQGAKIVFADSSPLHPNLDETLIEPLVTSKTKAIVVVHYAGNSCNMHNIMLLAEKYNLFVVEDAAQAIDSYYTFPDGTTKVLGSIGHLAAFSFHETKNLQCGEGGLLVVNDERFVRRSEIIWEKGTNRAEFFRGEVNKYGWVDIGSSFLPADTIAAFLYAQLLDMEAIQKKRLELWKLYEVLLSDLSPAYYKLPHLFPYATNNGHMFYLVVDQIDTRSTLIQYLKQNEVMAVFHYLSLHQSPYYSPHHDGRSLQQADHFSERLVRLPLFHDLEKAQVEEICGLIHDFTNSLKNG